VGVGRVGSRSTAPAGRTGTEPSPAAWYEGAMPLSPRLFVLSPATLAGVRGRRILDGTSGADFMEALDDGGTVPLGDVYAHISSLYYRGKRSYARCFARPARDGDGVFVVTPTRGLVPDRSPVSARDLRVFASVDIDLADRRYREPLDRTAHALADAFSAGAEVVLLGSIASGKYLDPLGAVFGERLLVPCSFVGRGDMSRGGLLLRAVDAGEELDYAIALDTERRGARPPRLTPRRKKRSS